MGELQFRRRLRVAFQIRPERSSPGWKGNATSDFTQVQTASAIINSGPIAEQAVIWSWMDLTSAGMFRADRTMKCLSNEPGGRTCLTIRRLLMGTMLLVSLCAALWIRRPQRQIAESAEAPPADVSAAADSSTASTEGDSRDELHRELTYARDIAPIVQQHCVVCHRPGDVGPFPLLTYEDVGRHARQICLVTERRLMPPWRPVPEIRHFRDDLRLSHRQIEMIRAWTVAGKPRGNSSDLPPPVQFESGWRLGTPDLVLQVPEPFEVPADGPDIYRYFVLPTGLNADRLVAAVEFRPGTPSVVHHAGFWFDLTGQARVLDARDPGPGYTNFGGPGIPGWIGLGNWTPGTTPRRLPAGTGRLVQKGSDLVLQVHYHPTGKSRAPTNRVSLCILLRPPRTTSWERSRLRT